MQTTKIENELKRALYPDPRFAQAFLLEWELVVLASVGFKYGLLRELSVLAFEIQRRIPRGVISVLLFGRGEFVKQAFASRFGSGIKIKGEGNGTD